MAIKNYDLKTSMRYAQFRGGSSSQQLSLLRTKTNCPVKTERCVTSRRQSWDLANKYTEKKKEGRRKGSLNRMSIIDSFQFLISSTFVEEDEFEKGFSTQEQKNGETSIFNIKPSSLLLYRTDQQQVHHSPGLTQSSIDFFSSFLLSLKSSPIDPHKHTHARVYYFPYFFLSSGFHVKISHFD